jgi:N-methylhydantoinase A
MSYLIGVDIGGTFTDCIAIDDAGKITIGKAPSTPPDFQTGFIDAVRETARSLDLSLEDLLAQTRGLYHGCTVGTNALVERRTAEVALLTTSGHADVIFTMQAGGRLNGMPPEYIAHVAAQTKDTPLVGKDRVVEVHERITFDGEVLVELDEDGCRAAIRSQLDAGVKTFAVSLLWSIVNPAHERRVKELIEELDPDTFISTSFEVSPRSGEYERTVATVVNALIGPVMQAYLRDLELDLRKVGFEEGIQVMSCSGGLISAEYARRMPVLTVGSGPVAGVIGADTLTTAASGAAAAGDLITADMGGTTFDVGVIRDGAPLRRPTTRYGQYEYFVPTLDVRSVGSGGGSIIRFDPDTATLRVGPQSAGARPGPVAYGRGGTEATVTDADLTLGYLNPDYFLGGSISLGAEAAREALARAGEPLGFDAQQTAAAAGRIVDSQMADAIRLASVQQGYDPRGYTLYAYGGAGPVHASAVARELAMKRIVVPLGDLAAGWSAYGIASSDAVVIEEMAKTLVYPFDPDEMNETWRQLEGQVRESMAHQGVDVNALELERVADIRYSQQINQVAVNAPSGDYDSGLIDELVGRFEEEYERLFGAGSGYAAAGFVLTSMRVRAQARLGDFELTAPAGEGSGATTGEPKGSREVIWYEDSLDPTPTPIYDGDSYAVGSTISGPAIVEFVDTTLVLRAGDVAQVDPLGSIVIDLGEADG